jgi:hypothetical protein
MDQISSHQAPHQSYQSLINSHKKNALNQAGALDQKAAPQHVKPSHNARTAGTMPVWSSNKTITPQGFAPNGQEDISFDQLIAAPSTEKGSIAQKYTRDSNPEYADVSIGDFVDIINPLHHIPLLGNLYRGITGDEIKPPARIMGGGIYGGPIGMASAMVNTVIEDQTGGDIGENMMSAFSPSEPSTKNSIQNGSLTENRSPENHPPENRAMSFNEAKAYYAHKPIKEEATTNKSSANSAPDFFSNNENSDITKIINEKQQNKESYASPHAFNFVATNTANIEETTSFGPSRTIGEMPEYSPKTIGLEQKTTLAAELRMDNPTAREPVTSITFD